MKLLKKERTRVILISLSLIFAFGVMTSVAQEKEIRDFFQKKVMPSAAQATAQTLKWKNYSYVTKTEGEPVGDVEGHTLGFATRRGFAIFENGEVATVSSVITNDMIKGSGSSLQYTTMTFADGSTIIMKVQYRVEATAPGAQTSSTSTREIIKGTGRFEGIKGTGTGTTKYLPLEKGELGQKGIGDFGITYTLPSK
jgi:hypothetical protein